MNKYIEGGIFSLLSKTFRKYWYWYIFGTACLFGTHYCQSYLPFFAKDLAEQISKNPELIDLKKFIWLALGIITFRTSSRLLFFTPARFLERDMRMEIVRLMEAVSPFRYKSWSEGQLFTVIFSDIQQMRALVGFAILQMGNTIIALFILVPRLYKFDSKLVAAYSPMFIAMILLATIVSLHQPYFVKVQKLFGDVQNFLIESYNGKHSIKNYQAEQSFIDLFIEHCKKELGFFFKSTRGAAVSIPLVYVSTGISFVWGAHIVQENQLGASSLILFSGFIFLLLEPLMYLSWIGVVFTRSSASWKRIRELTDSASKESDIELKLKDKNDFSGKLKREEEINLTFPFWSPCEEITLDIQENSWNCLVGRTGCGKTTALEYIAEIFKGNKLSVSMVSQEPYLYNDTIYRNIFLGQEPSPEAELRAYDYLELFGLTHLEKDRESLFSLEVGENGKRLSGGQAKRVCLVRSIMSEAGYLIWDDPFSSVDMILEKVIIEKLKADKEFSSKTLLMSSHRLSTVRYCEKIFFLEKEIGILESGATSELLTGQTKTNEYFQKQLV